MGELKNKRSERIAQLLFKKKSKQTKKDLCDKLNDGTQYPYFTEICRSKAVKERVLELQTEEKNKLIMGKEERLEALTKLINETDDADTKIKAIQALDRIDDRSAIDTDSTHKQIIIKLPDNKRN